MIVKFKKLNSAAITPTRGTEFSAGLDLTAISKDKVYHKNHGYLEYISYSTGLAVEIPEGFVGLIFPRSSISKYNLSLSNAVGVIDADYRGEISFRFKALGSASIGEYDIGDRIGQLLIVPNPTIDLVEVDELNETTRGDNGYGSTNFKKCEPSQAV